MKQILIFFGLRYTYAVVKAIHSGPSGPVEFKPFVSKANAQRHMMNLRIDFIIASKEVSLMNIGTEGDGFNFRVGNNVPYCIYYLVRRE